MGNGLTKAVLVLGASLVLVQCGGGKFVSRETADTGLLSDETVVLHASGGWLPVADATVITDNDEAFRSKLSLIKSAETSIDAMYYIYATDLSSSVLSEALIAAARRGVKVRLMVDYHQGYQHLDFFSMMEREGGQGAGSLEVRLYNRPTRDMVMDAAYITMPCGTPDQPVSSEACHTWKEAEVERLFAGERIDGRPASEMDISNLNVAGSGVFLSGFYSKSNPQLMALAVEHGQRIDREALMSDTPSMTPEDKEGLKKIGKIYWQARTGGPFTRLTSNIKLYLALSLFGETLNPIYDSFRTYLPVERSKSSAAARDWAYASEFMHHKLLLVDGRTIQLGGRNVEDSYHMRPNPLGAKYVFMDTDYVAQLDGENGMTAAFDSLWSFRTMVASLDEVRSHAPNEAASNVEAFVQAAEACDSSPKPEECVDNELQARIEPRADRETRQRDLMEHNAERYRTAYEFRDSAAEGPSFAVDPDARTVYVENLPFVGEGENRRRTYGAASGEEAERGKRIQGLWLRALESVCVEASATQPKRIVLHNAYFILPADLLSQFGRMVDGTLDCSGVTVQVLTNSLETTDLKPVNLGARHIIKAFAEFYLAKRDPDRGAVFRYGEYRTPAGAANRSLHSKVFVLGDDIFVGSANADTRSLMLDSNNGVFIRGADDLHDRYLAYVDGLLGNPERVADRTRYFAEVTDQDLMAEDKATVNAMLDRWASGKVSAEQIKEIEGRTVVFLQRVFHLAKVILEKGEDAEDAIAEFDLRLKQL